MQTNNFLQIQECLDKVISKLKPKSSTKVKTAIVALYSADQNQQLRYSSKITILNLDYDRQIKAYLLRFYDLDTLQLLFQMELYYGFADVYRKIQNAQNMYAFQLWDNGAIGIQFRNQMEAQLFQLKLKQVAPKMSEFQALKRKHEEEIEQQKKQNSFFSRLKKKFYYGKQQQKPIVRQSVVLQVSKQTTIKLDGQGGLIFSVLPPQWQEIIAKAGLKLSDLQDKQIANIICQQTIIYQLNKYEQNLHVDHEISDCGNIQFGQHAENEQTNHNCTEKQQQKDNNYTNKFIENNTLISDANLPFEQTNHPSMLPSDHPPIPPLNLLPPLLQSLPQITQQQNCNLQNNIRRQNLLQQIRSNNIKLKPVTNCKDGILIDASSMSKQQRNDLSELIRMRLHARKLALNRRKIQENDQQDQ